MKRSPLVVLALGAGLALASPLLAETTTNAPQPECPPKTIANFECPPAPANENEPPKAEDGPKPQREFLHRVFRAEGDVLQVEADGRRGTICLQDAELIKARRFAELLESGDLKVQVTARTKIVDEDGERIALEDIEKDDAVRVRGKFAPMVRWSDNGDGTRIPLMIAKRVVVLD